VPDPTRVSDDRFQGQTDVSMTPEGDIELENGDFRIIDGIEWLSQSTHFVLKTYPGDFRLDPGLGCIAPDYIGMPNTPENAQEIKDSIRNAMNYDVWSVPGRFNCRVVPTDKNEVSAFVYIDLPGESRVYLNMLQFDYTGLGVESVQLYRQSQQPATVETTIGRHAVPENKYLQRIHDAQYLNQQPEGGAV